MEIAWSSEVAAVGAEVPQMKTRGTSVYSNWGNYLLGGLFHRCRLFL